MLVAEDQENEAEILRLACQRAKISLPLQFVRNGVEAMAYLKGEGRFADRAQHPLPKLLLLDLRMPLVGGFEVLGWLRLQPGLRRLVVIVFTSSALPEDINRAFELGANSYLIKPAGLDELAAVVRYLEQYWLELNQCPDCSDGRQDSSSMRVLLRNPKTGLYFMAGKAWSPDRTKALNFERSERATQAALGMRLPEFDVVVEQREAEGGGRGIGAV